MLELGGFGAIKQSQLGIEGSYPEKYRRPNY